MRLILPPLTPTPWEGTMKDEKTDYNYRLRMIHIGSGYAKDYYGLDVYPTLAEATASANTTNNKSANWYANIEEI